MKDFIFTTFGSVPIIAIISQDEIGTWEHLFEKWGIGLVGLGFFCVLAWWTAKREDCDKLERNKKEEENQAERKDLMKENIELQKAQITMMEKHITRVEQLTREANHSREDNSRALRMMFQKLGGLPCVVQLHKSDIDDYLPSLANKPTVETD